MIFKNGYTEEKASGRIKQLIDVLGTIKSEHIFMEESSCFVCFGAEITSDGETCYFCEGSGKCFNISVPLYKLVDGDE